METMKREWGGSRGQRITGLFKMLIREVHKKSWETSEMSERQYPAYFSETEQHVQATLTVYNSQIQPPLSGQADYQEPYKLQAIISFGCLCINRPVSPSRYFQHKKPNVLNTPSI